MFKKNKTDTSSISFTAHYTGYVWYKNELAAPFFKTSQGTAYYHLMHPFESLGHAIVGSNIKTSLLQRHLMIDALIKESVEQQGYEQILEIACGLSPRGHHFSEKYSDRLRYVEADLPAMAKTKQALLEQNNALSANHKVVRCNILELDTEDALEKVLSAQFDSSKPILVITEGLINYFNLDTISSVWQRLQSALTAFPKAKYISDNYPLLDGHPYKGLMRFFQNLLGSASRSQVNFHFTNDQEIEQHFEGLGFTSCKSHNPEDYYDTLQIPKSRTSPFVRIIEAELAKS